MPLAIALLFLAFTTPQAAAKNVVAWGASEIQASHTLHKADQLLAKAPQFDADPLNLFVVVEAGDHHVTILDGDTFVPLARFKTHFAVEGEAEFSPDGRFVYLASRNGWITKHDLWGLEAVAEIRAGINTSSVAVSSDGKWVIAGNDQPGTVVILHAADLSLFRVVSATNSKGTAASRVSAVYDAPPRQSFIVALKDFKEIWEMSYDPDAAPVYVGFAHNYRKGQEEGTIEEPQPFARRRIKLQNHLDTFSFDPYYAEIIGAFRDGGGAIVFNLDARRKASDLDLEGMPNLESGIIFPHEGRTVMATPHLKDGTVSVIDLESWKTVKTIKTKGPGVFMRSHQNTPYAWVDVFFGPNKDVLHVIDKRTLEIVRDVVPEKGKLAAHVEFTRDGKYALVSIWENDGALVVYDAATLEEVKRIPMKKPVGKYNVFNKISRSRGAGH